MYTNTVRLPYTLWYDGHDKIFRMDMSTILPEEHYEDGKNYVIMTIPFSSLRELPIATALTENVVTETIKPTLDKSYYSKQEVDQLIQQLKHELMSEDHGEEHPQ